MSCPPSLKDLDMPTCRDSEILQLCASIILHTIGRSAHNPIENGQLSDQNRTVADSSESDRNWP